MDKDEYLKILHERCSYNPDNYLIDKEWAIVSGLCQVQKDAKDDEARSSEYSKLETNTEMKRNRELNKNEKNWMKILE
jgi:hypothetical protein